jgi:hypothetical protein
MTTGRLRLKPGQGDPEWIDAVGSVLASSRANVARKTSLQHWAGRRRPIASIPGPSGNDRANRALRKTDREQTTMSNVGFRIFTGCSRVPISRTKAKFGREMAIRVVITEGKWDQALTDEAQEGCEIIDDSRARSRVLSAQDAAFP